MLDDLLRTEELITPQALNKPVEGYHIEMQVNIDENHIFELRQKDF